MKEKSNTNKEMNKLVEEFNHFDESIKEMTMDRMNATPKQETEMQTKLSQNEITKALAKEHYLKPHKTIGCKEKFNEKYRDEYNHMKTYVAFIAENKELQGETLDLWTRPFPGVPAEEWLVPTNKPVWGPRYLAEQIKRKYYHRLVMQEKTVTGADGYGQYYGQMAADTTIQRLDAHPVNSTKKSVFMGAGES